MRSEVRASPEAEHTVWWLLLCRAVEQRVLAALAAREGEPASADGMVDRAFNRFEIAMQQPTTDAGRRAKVHALVNAGPWPGMSEAFDAHVGAPAWTDPDWRRDASLWAAAWRTASARVGAQPASAEQQPVYGIFDPDYARVFTIARCLARTEGYALAMHGSFTRDLDLLAVPWTDHACEADHLVARIADACKLKPIGGPPSDKPHGRRAWTLLFPEFGDPRFIDLSVMPRAVLKKEKA